MASLQHVAGPKGWDAGELLREAQELYNDEVLAEKEPGLTLVQARRLHDGSLPPWSPRAPDLEQG
jgi:hypothetical protein